MLSAASPRYRFRTIERLGVDERTMVTFILVDSEQDMRRALRAITDPHDHQQTLVAVTGEVIAGTGESEVWQQGGYGFSATTTVMPNVTLSAIVRRVHASPDGIRRLYVGSGGRSRQNISAGLPEPAEQLDQAVAIALSRAEKRLLDLLPTHRYQLSYEHRGTRYPLYPDGSFLLRSGEDWHWCLLEFERRATTTRCVPERLRACSAMPIHDAATLMTRNVVMGISSQAPPRCGRGSSPAIYVHLPKRRCVGNVNRSIPRMSADQANRPRER